MKDGVYLVKWIFIDVCYRYWFGKYILFWFCGGGDELFFFLLNINLFFVLLLFYVY